MKEIKETKKKSEKIEEIPKIKSNRKEFAIEIDEKKKGKKTRKVKEEVE